MGGIEREPNTRAGFQFNQPGFRAHAPDHGLGGFSIWHHDTTLPGRSQGPEATKMLLHRCMKTVLECWHLGVLPHRAQTTRTGRIGHRALLELWSGYHSVGCYKPTGKQCGASYLLTLEMSYLHPLPFLQSRLRVSWPGMSQCPLSTHYQTCFRPLGVSWLTISKHKGFLRA